MNEKDTQTVERVAKAINGPHDSSIIGIEELHKLQEYRWKRQTTKPERERCLNQARAAIAAMPDTTAQADTVTPHYCYDPESWEYTMQWSNREELVEDWDCGQAHKVATLVQGPDKWVAHIPIDTTGFGEADDLETHWFDSEEAALRATQGNQHDL